MEIKSPVWHLKDPRCDCCDGQGALCFSACVRCDWVLLVCDEVGTVFANPKALTRGPQGNIADSSYLCPNCGQVAVSDFKNATGDEIQRLGFCAGEYE